MTYIGIDNGVTGTICIINPKSVYFFKTPSKKHRKYTVKKQYYNRIWHKQLTYIFKNKIDNLKQCICYIEKPYTNSIGKRAVESASRADEATLIVLEQLEIPYKYITSTTWQKIYLPGIKGKDKLKPASLKVGNALYPQFANVKHEDRDGLLIAVYAKQHEEKVMTI